jgi:hypothetical protein
LNEKADNMTRLGREIARTKQQLSEAQRITLPISRPSESVKAAHDGN